MQTRVDCQNKVAIVFHVQNELPAPFPITVHHPSSYGKYHLPHLINPARLSTEKSQAVAPLSPLVAQTRTPFVVLDTKQRTSLPTGPLGTCLSTPNPPSVPRSNCLRLHRPFSLSLSLAHFISQDHEPSPQLSNLRSTSKTAPDSSNPLKRPKKKTMAIFTNSSLSISSSTPPLKNSSPPRPKPSQVSQWPASRDAEWRSKSVVTAAAVIVTIGAAAAIDGRAVLAAETGSAVAASGEMRWSEKRKCPPWRVNTLESIVPENLPRPPPGRIPDAVTDFGDAPAVAGHAQLRRYSGGCFSL